MIMMTAEERKTVADFKARTEDYFMASMGSHRRI
jgi:hypothetical protein